MRPKSLCNLFDRRNIGSYKNIECRRHSGLLPLLETNAQEKKPGIQGVGGWMGQRAVLDILKKRKSFASVRIAQPCKRKFFLIIYLSVW